MNKINADINLDSYIIDTINYKINEDYINEEDNIDIKISFDNDISINEELKKARIRIGCYIFKGYKDSPFNLDLNITGYFSYNSKYSVSEIEKLILVNGTAILFPYLRSMITTITANSGYVPIIIPTVNINKLLNIE